MTSYDCVAAFMAELAAAGVRDVVISPGSRSTPLALCAAARNDLTVHVELDERAAAFYALGRAKSLRSPVALVCTSGTAVANYLPGVVEAHYAGVPLVVLTADRPAELRDQGAGQTIDQVGIFGTHVRRCVEMPVAGDVAPAAFRREAHRLVAAACGARPGPVHANWPLREPLHPAGDVPVADAVISPIARSVSTPASEAIDTLVRLVEVYERGIVAVGPIDLASRGVTAMMAFAAAAGWPILADPASQLRVRGDGPVVATADHLLRHDFAAAHGADVVVRVGATPTSKPLRLWLERSRPSHTVVLTEPGRLEEPAFAANFVVEGDPVLIAEAVVERVATHRRGSGWLDAWRLGDVAVTGALDGALDGLTEPVIARVVGSTLPTGAALYVSNSMPVRDVDGFMAVRPDPVRVFVNRGANGIDGIVASARGVASAGRPTVVLLGDVALLHDIGSVLTAARSDADLTVVVVDNDGGGIFAFLPVHGAVDHDRFEQLFGTPHGTDLSFLRSVDGVRYASPASAAELEEVLGESVGRSGLDVVHVEVSRADTVMERRRIDAAVAAALSS